MSRKEMRTRLLSLVDNRGTVDTLEELANVCRYISLDNKDYDRHAEKSWMKTAMIIHNAAQSIVKNHGAI